MDIFYYDLCIHLTDVTYGVLKKTRANTDEETMGAALRPALVAAARVVYHRHCMSPAFQAQLGNSIKTSVAWWAFDALPAWVDPAAATAAKGKPEDSLQPKLVAFDESTGKATSAQTVLGTTKKDNKETWITLPTREWRAQTACQNTGKDASFGGAVLLVLWMKHLSQTPDPVDVQDRLEDSRRRVTAREAKKEKDIVLWPCVPLCSRLATASSHGDKVEVGVWLEAFEGKQKGELLEDFMTTYYLNPEWRSPRAKNGCRGASAAARTARVEMGRQRNHAPFLGSPEVDGGAADGARQKSRNGGRHLAIQHGL